MKKNSFFYYTHRNNSLLFIIVIYTSSKSLMTEGNDNRSGCMFGRTLSRYYNSGENDLYRGNGECERVRKVLLRVKIFAAKLMGSTDRVMCGK